MRNNRNFTNFKKIICVSFLSFSTALSISTVSYADESGWKPDGPVRMIMHTSAGGAADIFMRTLSESLEPKIGASIAVINSPGGGGAAQMSRVRSADPDGLTLGVNTLSHFTSMLTNLKGTFAIDDFSWIASAQTDPILVLAESGSEFQNLINLIEEANARESRVTIGGFGPEGSMQHIALSMLEDAADVEFEWVAFESTPDIVAAVLGGHVDAGMASPGGVQAYFEAGRLQGLGVLGEERLEGFDEVETFGEQGFDVDTNWMQVRGIFGPADTPMETQQKIADAFHEAMKSDHYQEYARNAGVTDSWMGPEEYAEYVREISDVAKAQLEK